MASSLARSPGEPARVLFVNPSSGTHEVPADELEALLPGFAVREVGPSELPVAIEAAVERGVDVLGVSGGDGSIRSAAEVLAGTDVPLLVVPGGTFNHFAKAIGVPDLAAASAAATDGVVEPIDVADVNRRVFVNNASIGWYTELVRTRERFEGRLGRRLARVVSLVVHLPRIRRFRVEAAGHDLRAWVVWVGNGRISTAIGGLGEREQIDDGLLDVFVARAEGVAPRLRQLSYLLAGRLDRSPLVERWTASSMTFSFKRASVYVALDGEVVRLATPLRFSVRARALRLLVPPPPSQ